MQVRLSRYAGISMVVAVCLALGACKGRENAATSDTANRAGSDTAMGGMAKASDTARKVTLISREPRALRSPRLQIAVRDGRS